MLLSGAGQVDAALDSNSGVSPAIAMHYQVNVSVQLIG